MAFDGRSLVPGKGYLFKRHKCWFYIVIGKQGSIVLSDNTNDYSQMVASVRRDVAAVRRVEGAGHVLRPYRQLVDEASNRL